ncbi:hypothetical protein IRZ83_05390 [Flavobacterium sp. JLP]|uniref:hypothetical protein n=1 Tax=unclassified Flavobacterium TaxID=196869 RepID=UPI00188A112E|nr:MULTISPECIES: hypothetical protein [unclassified Flavobacterium]MBF4492071.1 hypothetical protein [Flavobacterium sp. MR2016-29]MBF4506095.1 hypothetical protein [Flavobacterium sp. JLP]
MKKLNPFIAVIFVISISIILLNRYTQFNINDYRVHFFFLFFATSSLVIIIGQFFKKLQTNWSIISVAIIIGILCVLKAFFTWGGDWKTQTVLYSNIDNPAKTINYQLRGDRFAFGYKKRVVSIYRLAPFIEWTTDIDTLHLDKTKWKKLNLKLNEMKLK